MEQFHLEAAKILTELKSKSNIRLITYIAFEDWIYDQKLLDFSVEKNKERYNFVFSEKLVELFLMPTKVKLHWAFDQENISGSFLLHNLPATIRLIESNIEGYDEVFDERNVSQETREMFRKSRYIDYIENYGYACIMKEDDNTWDLNSIWFMQEDDLAFYKLDLDLETYFRTVLTLKGANFWQFLFYDIIAKEDYIDRYYMEHICRWIVKLPELFPNHDYSEAIKRYKFIAEKNPNERDIASTNEKLKAMGLW